MASAFPPIPPRFVGRDEYLVRFKARREHFNLFIYGGMPGVGKTSLLLRLARETRAVGLTNAIYLSLQPGEGIASILARVEARSRQRSGGGSNRQGDPYARLVQALDKQRAALLLDELQNMKKEELPTFARAMRAHSGRFRVLAALHGDPELSAMELAQLHFERVSGFGVAEAVKLAAPAKLSEPELELLTTDVQKLGCLGHPLTLQVLLTLRRGGATLPDAEFFKRHSSRSLSGLKQILATFGDRLTQEELRALRTLSGIGQPLSKTLAVKAAGGGVNALLAENWLQELDGNIYVHELLAQHFNTGAAELSAARVKEVSKELIERAVTRNQSYDVINAAQLLNRAGEPSAAIEALAEGWEAIRDFGFLEAYIKVLSAIPADKGDADRARLLRARARMRQGNIAGVREEMERLTEVKDSYTKTQALASLTFIYSKLYEHAKVVESFEALRALSPAQDVLVPAGVLAATSMMKLERLQDAQKLARELLAKLQGGKQSDREAELHRLLARAHSQSGALADAVKEAGLAAKCFETAGDLYHAATAQGFIGDLYRETGDFELAKKAFVRFHELAKQWGDRDLAQIAELADAWVSIDIGDITHAAKRVAEVEKEISAAPSKRLRRYLSAAKALMEVGRGHHDVAADLLVRVVESWEHAGQQSLTDMLRAHLIRSLIACGRLEDAQKQVDEARARIDETTAAPRAATFLRESALIRLRRKDSKRAMAELAQARKYFGEGGNRREEALTLHRIAHAALEQGDVALAESSAKEAYQLASKIKHARAIALAREMQGRIALLKDRPKEAVQLMKEAQGALRKLGDELGSLHVSESLLRALIVAGDLAGAIRLGPRVRDHAERLEIREVKVRAIVLSGMALLKRGRVDQAERCFRELPESFSSLTLALMWRLGEGLAAVGGDRKLALLRREKWVQMVRRMPENQQGHALHALEQLDLPPRERGRFTVKGTSKVVSTEAIGWLKPADYPLFIDMVHKRIYDGGVELLIEDPAQRSLFERLLKASPKPVAYKALHEKLFPRDRNKPERKVKPLLKELQKALKGAPHIKVMANASAAKLELPRTYALLTTTYADQPLTQAQRTMVKLLRRYGTAPMQTLQDAASLQKPQARKEVTALVKAGIVEAIRDGRGQVFRLA